jgi:hypothetical protein
VSHALGDRPTQLVQTLILGQQRSAINFRDTQKKFGMTKIPRFRADVDMSEMTAEAVSAQNSWPKSSGIRGSP